MPTPAPRPIRIALALCLATLGGCTLFESDPAPAGPDSGVGVTCTTSDACRGTLVCAAGTCQAEGSVRIGGSCWATRDCGPELYCSRQGVCAPAGEGGVGDDCATGGECAPDLRCELEGFSGTCQETGAGDVGDACETAAGCLGGLACGPEGTCQHPEVAYPPFTGVDCAADEGPFRVHFEVPRPDAPPADFFRLPFPSDARVRADGTLDLDDFPRPGPGTLGLDIVDLYADALTEDFRGFSPTGVVTMRLSGELDFETANEDSIHFIDVTAGAAEYGSERTRRWTYDPSRNAYRCPDALIVRSRAFDPLRAGHTYAVYATTDLRSAAGEAAVQDDDLAAVLADTRPAGEALAAAWDAHEPLRAYLADSGIDPATIAGAAVFTVQDAAARAKALAGAVEASAPPEVRDVTVCDEGVTSPCDDGGARTCSPSNPDFIEIHGRFSVPVFQEGTAPYEVPSDGGAIPFESGEPVQQGTEDVCFALTVPKGADAPADGWPLVVYAHGTGGSFTGVVDSGVASALATADAPTAVLSYDGVVHGERKAGSSKDPGTLMFNVVNPRAARDNHLQGAVDVLQALRMPQATVSAEGVGDVPLDGSRAYYVGHSQGSNVGIPALAVSGATDAAVLSGAGSYLSLAILSKTSPVDSRRGLELLVGDELSTDHPVMVIWQTFFDGVDTASYAPLLVQRPPEGVPSKNVLMTWGPADTFSPQPTLQVTARGAGLPVARPVLQDLDSGRVARPVSANVTAGDGADRTAACFQYPTDGYDGHFVGLRNPDAIADWVGFLTSAQSGVPTVQ